MTKTDLIAQVAANTEMSKKSAEMAVNAADLHLRLRHLRSA